MPRSDGAVVYICTYALSLGMYSTVCAYIPILLLTQGGGGGVLGPMSRGSGKGGGRVT